MFEVSKVLLTFEGGRVNATPNVTIVTDGVAFDATRLWAARPPPPPNVRPAVNAALRTARELERIALARPPGDAERARFSEVARSWRWYAADLRRRAGEARDRRAAWEGELQRLRAQAPGAAAARSPESRGDEGRKARVRRAARRARVKRLGRAMARVCHRWRLALQLVEHGLQRAGRAPRPSETPKGRRMGRALQRLLADLVEG